MFIPPVQEKPTPASMVVVASLTGTMPAVVASNFLSYSCLLNEDAPSRRLRFAVAAGAEDMVVADLKQELSTRGGVITEELMAAMGAGQLRGKVFDLAAEIIEEYQRPAHVPTESLRARISAQIESLEATSSLKAFQSRLATYEQEHANFVDEIRSVLKLQKQSRLPATLPQKRAEAERQLQAAEIDFVVHMRELFTPLGGTITVQRHQPLMVSWTPDIEQPEKRFHVSFGETIMAIPGEQVPTPLIPEQTERFRALNMYSYRAPISYGGLRDVGQRLRDVAIVPALRISLDDCKSGMFFALPLKTFDINPLPLGDLGELLHGRKAKQRAIPGI